MKKITVWWSLMLLLSAFAVPAWAQSASSEIHTVVPDRHTITVSCGAGGGYETDGKVYIGRQTFLAPRFGSFAVTARPESGYTLQTIVTDNAKGLTLSGNKAVISGICADTAITIRFQSISESSGTEDSPVSGETADSVVTVPIAGGGSNIHVQAETGSHTAAIQPPASAELATVVAEAERTGEAVTIDLSTLPKTIEQAVLPANIIEKVGASAAQEGVKGMNVLMPNGSQVSFDARATAAIASAADKDTLTLLAQKRSPAEMTPAEARQFTPEQTAQFIDLKLVDSRGTEIHDFDGGRAHVTISDVKMTSAPENYVLWHQAADGLQQVAFTYRPAAEAQHYQISFMTNGWSSFALVYAGQAASPFDDVTADDWFYQDVLYVYRAGLMRGTQASLFSPDLPLTRGMVVTILYRSEEPSSVRRDAPFTDVAPDSYYADAVAWAAAEHIVAGYGGGLFGPEDQVTREQLAAILYRYAAYKGYDVSSRASLDQFADQQDIANYARTAVSWAKAVGLLSGRAGGLLAPSGSASRAEAASILHRFCVLYPL